MDTTNTKNWIATIKNAIKLIQGVEAPWVKSGFTNGNNLLFFNNGNSCKFGLNSHYQLQYSPGFINNKKDVISNLNKDLKLAKIQLKLEENEIY